MENIIDFEYVLRPINEDQSEAAQVEYEKARRSFGSKRDALFQQEEALENHRLYGPEFEGVSAPEPPDWAEFINECQNHLAKQSKDFWICVWMMEALLASNGFKGLAEGIELLRSISEQYWERLQPPVSALNCGDTVKLLSAVSKRDAFVDAIRLAPITVESGQYLPASCATINNLEEGERAALIADTDEDFISQLYASAKKAATQWQLLDDFLEEKCGADKPPFAKVRDGLAACIGEITATYPQVITEDKPEETGLTVNENVSNGQTGDFSGGSHLKNREQAFKTLEALSRYFRENEPNSPISASLQQAIRWGRMSFNELLQDVVDDQELRRQILRLTGSRDDGDQDFDQ